MKSMTQSATGIDSKCAREITIFIMHIPFFVQPFGGCLSAVGYGGHGMLALVVNGTPYAFIYTFIRSSMVNKTRNFNFRKSRKVNVNLLFP